MDPLYDFYSWSEQRREEALGEAQRRSLARRAKQGAAERVFDRLRVRPALSVLLSLLK
jgi:hypothetical protein